LDAIAIKALEKDPASRYASPADMAADVEQFLQDRPISARSPGTLVRLRKVFRRHRRATVIIAALSVMLIGLVVVGTVQALRAQRASARAEAEAQVDKEVREFLLGVIDPPPEFVTGEWPLLADMRDASIRKTLLSRVRERFADQPELQSQLQFTV